MTTTLSRPSKVADGPTGGDFLRDGSVAKARGERLGRRLGVVGAVAVSAFAIWWGATWSRSPSDSAAIDKFTVEPRTFSVLLTEKGELKAANSTDIKCEVEGRSTIISLVEEGKAVKEGDLLVELASDEIDERIRETELKEANAITAYESAKTGRHVELA